MSDYVVITNYDESSNTAAGVVVNGDTYDVSNVFPMMNVNDLCRWSVGSGLTPLNFDINQQMQIEWNCGAKTRLSDGAVIILAEIRNKSKRTLGYKLLDIQTRATGNMRTKDIVAKASQTKVPYLQNGIVRNGTVNCYPEHKFPYLVIDDRVRSSDRVNKPKPQVQQQPVPQQGAQMQAHHATPTIVKERVMTPEDFTKAQLAELEKAKKEIGNVSIIYDPRFTPQQMRVLWVAKKKGACAEAFAIPEISLDAMKFYADRLVDLGTANECTMLLHRPDLKVEQLQELFLCILDGVPFDDLLDLSEEEIRVERFKRSNAFWGNFHINVSEIEEHAINYAMRLRGYDKQPQE